MLQIIGLIMGAYCVARLLQVPVQQSPKAMPWLWLVSVPTILLILVLTLGLLLTSAPKLPQ